MTRLAVPAPIDLRDYLKSLGWSLRPEALADRVFLLENEYYPGRQLTFPMDVSAPDYPEAVLLVLEKMSPLLQVAPEQILERLRFAKDDVIRLRIISPYHGDSFLPFEFASELVAAARKMIKSAACTVLKPRIHHPRLTLADANELTEKSRFGHTEPGSFLLKIALPLNALDIQPTLGLHEEPAPFVRRVTEAIFRSLESLVGAIEADRTTELVSQLKNEESPMLSSNFCDAVANLHNEQLNNDFELLVDWSALLPQPRRARMSRVLVGGDYFSRISEVGRELKSAHKPEEEMFVGTVERLEGEMSRDGRRSGDVVLSLLLPDGDPVLARTTLDAEQYVVADRAHMQEGAYVSVMGRLEPGRQPRRLTQVSNFAVLIEPHHSQPDLGL